MNLKNLNTRSIIFWGMLLTCAPLISYPEVYFSPTDKVQSKLIALIKQEKKSIKIAVYLITDVAIIEALGDAKRRGVAVEIVADALSFDSWGKAAALQAYDIPVYSYNRGQQSIMHNKFFIFGKNKDDKKLLWTGSFNPTQKADKHNRENVIIEDNEEVAQAYEREFETLKEISQPFVQEREKSLARFSLPKTEQFTGRTATAWLRW